MFGLSFTHLLLLGVIALVVLGPEQLPEVARTIARLLNEWKRATSDIQTSLTNTLREDLMKPNPRPPENTAAQPAPGLPEELPPHAPDTVTQEELHAQGHHDDPYHSDPEKKS